MVSYAPPTAILPFFNPAVFETDETALTIGEANKLYFKKSGGIITGSVSMPSLTLNGVNVENKLLEIDTVNAKLTDISYNNNVTYILNDLSINGVLKLPGLSNVGNDISSNKQKTTKISYDANTSVTTIADTLKASSTLIVGINNYNASDEFYKLTGISRGATPLLTITDAVDMNGILNLPNHGNIDTVLSNFDEILVNMTYTSGTSNLLTINSNVKIPQNLEVGTITDVEQKILDISNTTTNLETNVSGISYNTIQDLTTIDNSLNVTGNLQLNTITDVEQKILDISNTTTNLETILTDVSYVNSTTIVGGKLNIEESTGTTASATGGSLTLYHDNHGGESSIVFRNKTDLNTDFGYISYQDDYLNSSSSQRGLLELGVQNNGAGIYVDNIALMPSGFVGINTRTPQTMLDVNGDIKCNGNFELGTITDVEQKIIDISNNAGGSIPSITYDALTLTTTFDGSYIYIPTDLSFELGPLIPNLYTYILSLNSRTSWLENTGQGLKINNNTIIEENLGSRSSQLSIRPKDDIQDAVQEIYSKNGTSILKLGDDNGTTKTFSNILKSENGNATFYGNNSGETKFMEYNSTDDKINISKDMDLSLNDLNCRFMRPYLGGAKYFLSQNFNSSYLEFRNGGHHIDSFFTNGTGRPLYINYYSESNIILGSALNNSTTTVNGNLHIIETSGTVAGPQAGSLILEHNDIGGTSSITFKNRRNPGTDFGYILYKDDISGNSGNHRSLLEIGVENDSLSSNIDNIAIMPSGFLGINKQDPEYMLDLSGDMRTNGSIDCTEIKVNSIPINSFTSFNFGVDYTFGSITWGQNKILLFKNSSGTPLSGTPEKTHYSHQQQFTDLTSSEFKCNSNFFGTYEITADVIYRNDTGNTRHNPCIGISISSTDASGDIYNGNAPDFSVCPYGQSPFSAQYVRMTEGRGCSLNAKRIHHFTNSLDKVSIRQFIHTGGNTPYDFSEQATSYRILMATIKFKYIGNFDNIT